MKLKRITALLVSIATVAALVTGCGGAESSKKKANSATDIKISYWNSGYGSDWLDAAVEAFEKVHPEYNVILNVSSSNSGLLTSFGQADVDDTDLYLNVTQFDTDYLEPLSDVLEATVEGETKTIGEKFSDDFKEMAKFSDGEYYSLPYIGASGGYAIVYNKSMFDKYDIGVPRTTNELIVVADTLYAEDIPAFCSFQGAGYWRYALEVWYAQYEGKDYYYQNFYSCKDENGTSPSKEVLLKKDGRYAVLKAVESIMTPQYMLAGSNSATHTSIQTQFLNEKAAMMYNGSWLQNEMASVGGLDNFSIMRMPVLSAIVEKLTTVQNEAQLRKVITAVDQILDDEKTENDFQSGDAYVVDGLTVSAEDWKHVYEARCMTYGGYLDNTAYVPKYSTAKEAAKDFLKFLYSDEGIQLIADQMGGRLTSTMDKGELDTSKWNTFVREFDNMGQDAVYIHDQTTYTHPIFTLGGASLYAGIDFIPHFSTQNAADRWSADEVWKQVEQKVNDNYLPNWLANIK